MKTLLACLLVCCWLVAGPAQAADSFRADTLLRVAANPAQGFHYPYFLLAPKHTPRQQLVALLVEPNNTGTPNDTLAVHEQAARRAVNGPPRCLGPKMQPDRWMFCQRVYRQQHVSATFKTYPGIGHGTDMTVYRDLLAFFKAHQ